MKNNDKDSSAKLETLHKEIIETQSRFIKEYENYHTLLLQGCRAILKEIGRVGISEMIQENELEGIAKYYTPKDYPANFMLEIFYLDKSRKMSVVGVDIDDSDREWTFSEDDFSMEELEAIFEQLIEIRSFIKNEGYIVKDGQLTL